MMSLAKGATFNLPDLTQDTSKLLNALKMNDLE